MNTKLETAIRSEVFAAIPAKYLSTEERLELDQLDLRRLLSVFFNWRNRFITPRARTVRLSTELSAKNAAEIEGLVERIENGDDLNPHLSTRVEKVYTAAAARRSNRLAPRLDLDLLLSDWGIYHLHISTVDRGDGFVERDDPLLFGAFRRADAYLIELLNHGAWTNQTLVDIAERNWPNAKLFVTHRSLTLQHSASEEDRKKLRNAGIYTPVQLSDGGVAFSPGLTNRGDWFRPARNSMRCDHLNDRGERLIGVRSRGLRMWDQYTVHSTRGENQLYDELS